MSDFLDAATTLRVFGNNPAKAGIVIAKHVVTGALRCKADRAWYGSQVHSDCIPPTELWAGAPTWTIENWKIGMFTCAWSPPDFPVVKIEVGASGLIFRKDDVRKLIGETRLSRALYRKHNSGAPSFDHADAPLLVEMRGLIQGGQCKSLHEAAGQVAPKAKGASDESIRRRLSDKYKREYRD